MNWKYTRLASSICDRVRSRPIAFDLLVIAVAASWSFTWFQNEALVFGSDWLFPFNASREFVHRFSLWDPSVDFGSVRFNVARALRPRILLYTLIQALGVPNIYGQMVYVFLIRFVAGASVYVLVRVSWDTDISRSRTAALVATFAFLFSPAFVTSTFTTVLRPISLSVVPLFLAVIIRGLQKHEMQFGLYAALLSGVIMSSFPGFYYGLLSIFIVGVYLVWTLLVDVVRLDRAAFVESHSFTGKFLAVTGLMSVVVNMWWLLPTLRTLNAYLSIYQGVSSGPGTSYTLIKTLRLLADWGMTSGAFGLPYVPYAETYFENPFVVVATVLLPVLGGLALVVHRRSRMIGYFAVLALISAFFAKGTSPPFTGLYEWILSDMPLGRLLRGPRWFLLPLTLAYSVLIGSLVAFCTQWCRENVEKPELRMSMQASTVAVVIAVILVAGFPLVTGQVFQNWYSPDQRGTDMPEGYGEVAEQLQGTSGHVMVVPTAKTGPYMATSWGYQGSAEFYPQLLGTATVTGSGGFHGYNVPSKTYIDYLYTDAAQGIPYPGSIETAATVNPDTGWEIPTATNDSVSYRQDHLVWQFTPSNNSHQIVRRFESGIYASAMGSNSITCSNASTNRVTTKNHSWENPTALNDKVTPHDGRVIWNVTGEKGNHGHQIRMKFDQPRNLRGTVLCTAISSPRDKDVQIGLKDGNGTIGWYTVHTTTEGRQQVSIPLNLPPDHGTYNPSNVTAVYARTFTAQEGTSYPAAVMFKQLRFTERTSNATEVADSGLAVQRDGYLIAQLKASENLSSVTLGISDASRSVGWYRVDLQKGWQTVQVPLLTSPARGSFNRSNVTGVYLRYDANSDAGQSTHELGVGNVTFANEIGAARSFAEIAAFGNIEYVVFDQSMTEYKYTTEPVFLNEKMDSPALTQVVTGEYVTLYRVANASDRVSAAGTAVHVDSMEEMGAEIVEQPEEGTVFVTNRSVPVQNGTNATVLEFERSSPSTYTATVKADGPFYLSVAENYDDEWNLETEQPVDTHHFRANGFQNGWYFESGGTYQVTISYGPQRWVTYGITMTAIGVLAIIGLLAHLRRKSERDGTDRAE